MMGAPGRNRSILPKCAKRRNGGFGPLHPDMGLLLMTEHWFFRHRVAMRVAKVFQTSPGAKMGELPGIQVIRQVKVPLKIWLYSLAMAQLCCMLAMGKIKETFRQPMVVL